MDEFDFQEPQASLVETKPELIPLLREIHQVGFSRDVYDRGESIHPGLFKDIDPKMLSQQHSNIKRVVAMEAFGMDEQTSGLVAGGLGVAAAGMLAMGIYKLYKWFAGILSSDKDDEELPESGGESAKKAEDALDVATKKAEKEPEPAETPTGKEKGFDLKPYLRDKDGKTKITIRQIYQYCAKSASEKEAKEIMDLANKSKLIMEHPLVAMHFAYQGGVAAVLGAISEYKMDNSFFKELIAYSRAYYIAADAMFDYSMSPTDANLQKFKDAVTGLKNHGGVKPAIGKLINAMENGNIPVGGKRVCWKGPILPGTQEAKPVETFLLNDGPTFFWHNDLKALLEVIRLPSEFVDASGKESEKLDPDVARRASEKIKDANLADDVREIHKGLVRATRMRSLCRTLKASLERWAICNEQISNSLHKYAGKKS